MYKSIYLPVPCGLGAAGGEPVRVCVAPGMAVAGTGLHTFHFSLDTHLEHTSSIFSILVFLLWQQAD